MPGIMSRAIEVYHCQGPLQLGRKGVRYIYRNLTSQYDARVRPRFPRRPATYNEVTVRGARSFDTVVPWHTTDEPGYEEAIVRSIREHVSAGDTVTIVGGGWGVSTVAAAEQVGSEGTVVTFEGAGEQVDNVEETVHLNGVRDTATARHATIGRAVHLRGERDGGERLTPAELPACDVLVSDSEGAEIEILRDMNIRPSTIIVETHGWLGASEDEVRDMLHNGGYHVISRDVAEARVREFCKEKGIFVLIAKSS